MSIYTRTGDDGDTSLRDGTRVAKCDPRIEAYGALDTALATVGFARSATSDALLSDVLRFIQQRLFNCSAALGSAERASSATPSHAEQGRSAGPAAETFIAEDDIEVLERLTDRMMDDAEPVSGFVLPGGCETAARCHLARTAVREAERRIAASGVEGVDQLVLSFVNRCSDALFAAARYANASCGAPEEKWDRDSPAPSAG